MYSTLYKKVSVFDFLEKEKKLCLKKKSCFELYILSKTRFFNINNVF